VLVAVIVLLSVLPAGAGRAGDRLRENLAWVPDAEISLATTLLGRPDYVGDGYEAAKTWAMHKIAVIQAARGDVMGAKNTVAQIGSRGAIAEVTGVWFVNGRPVYDQPPSGGSCPASPGLSPCSLTPGYNYDGSIVRGFWFQNGQPIMACAAACAPWPDFSACDPKGPADQVPSAYGAGGRATPGPARVSLASQNSGERDVRASRNPANWERAAKQVSFKTPTDLLPNYLAPDPLHGAVVDFSDDRDSRGTRVTLRKYADGHAVIETPSSGRAPQQF
jgi:hypothetical protein